MHLSGGMPVREFVDSTGALWRVWSTIPSYGRAFGDSYSLGWLTFESKHGRRRLSPIPPDWEEAPASRLETLCGQAANVVGWRMEYDRDQRDI